MGRAEDRSCYPALRSPPVALCRQYGLAQSRLKGPPHRLRSYKVVAVVDQHLLDEVGGADEDRFAS